MHINAHLEVDLVAVESADTVGVMLEMKAPEAVVDPAVTRPQHTAIIVLDRSGSMSGGRLESAKRAIVELVARLDDRDNLGVVSFDNRVEVTVPAGAVGDLGRDRIIQAVQGIRPGGSTDLSGGYLRGLQEASRVAGPAGATLVLLSDGHANAGITDAAQMEQIAARAGLARTSTSTIGVGEGYDEVLLAALAVGGSGNHSFAREADAAAAALAGEIDGLLSTTVQAASLFVEPTSEVTEIQVLNDLPGQAVGTGVMLELGDFYGGEERRVVVEFRVPAMAELGVAQIAQLTLTHVELPALQQHQVSIPISVNVVPGDEAAGRVASVKVQREKLLLQAQKSKAAAEEALRRGDIDAARATLDEAGEMLAGAPPEVHDADVAAEAGWLTETRVGLDRWDREYSSKRVRSDRTLKGRGYRTRAQGGEVDPFTDAGER